MKNRRLISGNRVIGRCSMELPKVDPFSNIKTNCKGFLVFNTRGGCLYLPQQFTGFTIHKIFKPDEAGLVKNFELYTENNEKYHFGEMQARFLHFRKGPKYSGMVIRFLNQTERQLDSLNELINLLPNIGDDEDVHVQQLFNATQLKKAI